MGLIKEPLGIDFYFEEKQMTEDDQKRVSDYIAKSKKRKRVPVNGSNYIVEDAINTINEEAEKYISTKATTHSAEKSHDKVRKQRKMR